MTELQHKEQFLNQDITFGGIVTNVRNGVGKSGQPYGIVSIEDYSGTGELPLWGQDWATWGSYMGIGNSIYIQARVQPGKYNPNRIDLTIGKIEFLSDVKDQLIESITISCPLTELNDDIVLTLSTLTEDSPGNAMLYFNIIDPEGKQNLKLQSENKRINVGQRLLDYIESQEHLSYKINV